MNSPSTTISIQIRHKRRARGTILLFVLIMLSLMTTLVLGSIYRTQTELKITNHLAKNTQAHYLALGAVERALVFISQEELTEQRIARIATFRGSDQEEQLFKHVENGAFRGQALNYTIFDEQALFNLNGRFVDRFEYLVGRQNAARLLDWADQDNVPLGPEGAESDTYIGMATPYNAANRPFYALKEMCFIKDTSSSHYAGEDSNNNGQLDDNERDGDISFPLDNRDEVLDLGLVSLFTTVGSDKINLNTTSPAILNAIGGLDDPPAVELFLNHRTGMDQIIGTEDDVCFVQAEDLVIDGLTETQVSILQDTSRFCFKSKFFRILVHAKLPSAPACNLMATIHCTSKKPKIIFLERLP